MELGIYTFAERTPDPATGETIGFGPRLRNLIEEIRTVQGVRRTETRMVLKKYNGNNKQDL